MSWKVGDWPPVPMVNWPGYFTSSRSASSCRSAFSRVSVANENRGPPMPKCTDQTVHLGRVGRRVVEAAFDGGDIVSDGGVLLLKQVDDRLGLSRAAALAFGDERRSASHKSRWTSSRWPISIRPGRPSSACSASSSTRPRHGTRRAGSSLGSSMASTAPTRAASSPICRARPRPCTSAGTAHAARPKIASRKPNSTCSAGVPVATATRPTNSVCCSSRWPTR